MKLLLNDPRVDPAVSNNVVIQYASSIGDVEVVKLLLEDPRVNPTANDNVAIRFASANGHVDVVNLLREKSEGANRYYLQHIKK